MARTQDGNRILVRNLSNSLTLNGSSSTVNFGTTDFAFERDESFSVFAWVFIENISGSGMIFGRKESTGSVVKGWQLRFDQSISKISVALTNDGSVPNNLVVNSVPQVSVGKWTHVGFTYSGNSLASGVIIYINGVAVSNVTVLNSLSAGIVPSGIITSLGSRNAANQFFKGRIGKTYIKKSVLTAQEVSDIYRNEIYPSGAYAFYTFSEGSGTTLTDSSGNGRNGTIVSSSWNTTGPITLRTLASTRTLASSRTLVT